jgi:Predicted amidophosphoribosyltransferases
LADFLAEKIRLEIAQIGALDLLVPVPLYWRDQRRRGYNQAAVITAQLSQKLQIPVIHALSKPRPRAHQQQLSRAQRLRDIRGVFTTTETLSGVHVGLVDDVITTGATVEAISSQLIAAGAASVTVFALARTPKDR